MNTLIKASIFVETNNIFINSNRLYPYFGKKSPLYFCVNETQNKDEYPLCLRLTDIFSALKIPESATVYTFYYYGITIEKNKLYKDYFLTIENAIKLHENLASYK